MHKVLLRSVTLTYAQSLSLSQFGQVKKDIPGVHSSCAHFFTQLALHPHLSRLAVLERLAANNTRSFLVITARR